MQKTLLLFLLITLLLSCDNTTRVNQNIDFPDSETLKATDGETLCVLKENMEFIGRHINAIAKISDSSFVLLTNEAIIFYDWNGTQTKVITADGRSSSEFVCPSAIAVSDKFIYIWCNVLMKVLVYDYDGNYQTNHNGFNRALNKFSVSGDDKYLAMYTSGDNGKSIIKIFDIDTKKTIAEVGENSQEDIVLSFMSYSGAVAFGGNGMFMYIMPSSLNVNFCSIDATVSAEQIILSDNDFEVKSCKSSADVIDNGMYEVINYGLTNSVVRGVDVRDNDIYIMAETGIVKFSDGGTDYSNRYISLYHFDNNFNPIKKTKIEYNNMSLFMFDRNEFFTLSDSTIGEIRTLEIKSYKI